MTHQHHLEDQQRLKRKTIFISKIFPFKDIQDIPGKPGEPGEPEGPGYLQRSAIE